MCDKIEHISVLPGDEILLREHFLKEWKSIHKPKFIVNFFEEGPTICRPLTGFLSGFAVSHTGVVFDYRNIQRMKNHKHSVVIEPRIRNGNLLVSLHREDKTKSFLVCRLVLEAFYGIKLTDRVSVEFIDGNTLNPHYLNLEAFYL